MADRREAWWIPLLFGLAMAAMGCLIAGSLLGFIPTEPGAYFGPRWVMWMLAVGLLFAGVLLALAQSLPGVARAALGSVALLLFAGVCNWAAFAPGVHYFSSTSLGPISVEGEDPIGGRIAFGLAALLIDAVFLGGVVITLRKRSQRR
jgi:hypothetical protein